MVKVGIVIMVWFIGFFCIKVMKKIEPNNRLYSVWALFIATLFTLFAVYDGLG